MPNGWVSVSCRASVPSLALSPGEVTLQSLTAAYAAFANHGLVPRPSVIRRVEDQAGHVLYEAEPSLQRAMTDATAFLMSSMLADVVNGGTAARTRALGFTLPAAGKTGTTSEFKDAWFVGYTPKLVTGVWIGFDQPHTIRPNGFAAEVAVPVWANFMKRATRDDAPEWITPPAEVTSATICRLSGKLATARCEHVETAAGRPDERRSMVYTEYFARGTEPTAYCDRHQSVNLFARIGQLFGHVEKAAPPRTGDLDTASRSAADGAIQDHLRPAQLKNSRGFWSRILGRSPSSDARHALAK